LRRNLDPNALQVEFSPRSVTSLRRIVRVSVSDSNGDHLLKAFSFSHEIDPNSSSYKCTPLKVELKAAKMSAVQWSCLEGEDPTASLKLPGEFMVMSLNFLPLAFVCNAVLEGFPIFG
uniref:CS domain-containing protein n=1 Tax=Schistocephalus solidus TaxID=70667 RepID=A0A183SE48_SCHSO